LSVRRVVQNRAPLPSQLSRVHFLIALLANPSRRPHRRAPTPPHRCFVAVRHSPSQAAGERAPRGHRPARHGRRGSCFGVGQAVGFQVLPVAKLLRRGELSASNRLPGLLVVDTFRAGVHRVKEKLEHPRLQLGTPATPLATAASSPPSHSGHPRYFPFIEVKPPSPALTPRASPTSFGRRNRISGHAPPPSGERAPCKPRPDPVWHTRIRYRFCFRCCLVEFLSGSTSQGFDVRPCIIEFSRALYRLDPVKSGDASAGIRAVLGQYII
ncbi:hypothetical protein EJB05_08891, partial [Eragrostis curvula]